MRHNRTDLRKHRMDGRTVSVQHATQGTVRHTVGRVIFRWFAGRALDGRARTNSTFLRWADRDLTAHGRASRWAHRPGWHRSAWRTATVVILCAQVYGLAQARTVTLYADGVILCALCALGAWALRRTVVNWQHHRRIVKPVFEIAAMITGASSVRPHSPTSDPRKYLTVPRDFMTNEKVKVTFIVPETWEAQGSQQKRLNDVVTRKLGGDWDMRARLNEYPPRVEFVRSPAPPDTVSLADIKSAMDSGKGNDPVIGIGTHRRVIRINLDNEAPHIALSIGTGGGKSSLLRLIIAQLLAHGCERVDIIDPKRISHNWANGLPGVHIHRTMEAQMKAVHDFRLCMESRYDALDTDPKLTFKRRALIIEEQNSWAGLAKQYWDDYRRDLSPSERARTARSNPAIGDLAYSLYQGRQACMNVVSVFQRMSASAAGNGDMRENYGAKLLARFSPQTWAMLVGTKPTPRSSRINGRGIYVLGDEHHQVQFGYLREAVARDWPGVPESQWRDEARAYVLGALGSPEPAAQGAQGASVRLGEPAASQGAQGAQGEPGERVTLREAVTARIVPMRLGALRKARERDPRFPAPTGERGALGAVYAPVELAAWYAARTANRQRRAPVRA